MAARTFTEHKEEMQSKFSTGLYSAQQQAVEQARAAESDIVPDAPSFFKSFETVFETSNWVASSIKSETLKFTLDEYNPDYYAVDNLGEWKDTPYESILYGAKNQDHMAALKQYAQRKKENDEILEATPIGTRIFSELAAGVVSPEIFIPGSYMVKGAKGVSVLRTAATSAALGAAAMTVSETGLRISQPDRTGTQSAVSIGAGAVLGGILGGAASYLSKTEFDSLATKMMKEISDEAVDDGVPTYVGPASAGAAKVENLSSLTMDDLTIKGKMAQTYSYINSKLPYLRNPYNIVMNSQSTVGRQMLAGLVDMSVPLKAIETKALPIAAETEINTMKAGLGRYKRFHDEQFSLYKKAESQAGGKAMTYKAFNERVTYALRNGDIDPDGIDAVTKAAQKARSEILEPMRKYAVELGVFDEAVDAKFADSYLMRVWDRHKLIADEAGAMDMLTKWAEKKVGAFVNETNVRIKALAGSAAKEGSKQELELIKLREELASIRNAGSDGYDEYVKEIAEAMYKKLIGEQNFDNSFMRVPVARGPMKEKLLDIEDNVASPFLNNDAVSVLAKYNEKMSAELALTRTFGRADMADWFKKLDEDYGKLRKAEPDIKKKKAIDKEHKLVKRNLETVRDLLRGTYRKFNDPDSLSAQLHTVVRDLNYMSTLGGVTTSSLTDIGRVTMLHGMDRAFGDISATFISGMSKITKQFDAKEIEALGFDLEDVLSSQVIAYSDITDPLMRGTAITRATGYASDKFSKLTLINKWNDFAKTYGMRVTQTRILKALEAGDAIPKGEREYLRFLGIDDSTANIIRAQAKKHGQSVPGRKYSGVAEWDITDPNVARAKTIYTAALRKEANSMIVTRSVADIPMWANTAAGQLLFQLKSYVWAANQRVTMRGLSDANANTLAGIVMMVGIGMGISELKGAGYKFSQELQGKKPKDRKRSVQTRLLDGIDRSGVVPMIMEMNAASAALSGPTIQGALGAEPPSRYMQMTGPTRLLGPTYGQLVEGAAALARVGGAAITGDDVYSSDISKIRKALPFQNAIGVSYLFDMAQGGANKALGVK